MKMEKKKKKWIYNFGAIAHKVKSFDFRVLYLKKNFNVVLIFAPN